MNDAISNPFTNPFELRPAPPPPEGAPARIDFSGRRSDFWSMVSRGALLELVTFGFYRFWLATSMRRHLWSNTSVNGDAAELSVELLEGYTHLQLFSPPQRPIVAIEPMTAPIDALRSGDGLRIATEPFRAVFSIDLSEAS